MSDLWREAKSIFCRLRSKSAQNDNVLPEVEANPPEFIPTSKESSSSDDSDVEAPNTCSFEDLTRGQDTKQSQASCSPTQAVEAQSSLSNTCSSQDPTRGQDTEQSQESCSPTQAVEAQSSSSAGSTDLIVLQGRELTAGQVGHQHLQDSGDGAHVVGNVKTLNVYNNSRGEPRESGPSQKCLVDRNAWRPLVNTYKKVVGLQAIPEDKSQTKPMAYIKLYVATGLVPYWGMGQEANGQEFDSIEILFDPLLERGNRVEKVLVRGLQGSGKTVLCRSITFEWAHGRTAVRALPHGSTLPLYVDLETVKCDDKLENVLLILAQNGYAGDNKKIKEILENLGGNVLVMFDGYDRAHREVKEQVDKFIDNDERKGKRKKYFYSASVLMTSTPTLDEQQLDMFEKIFDIKGLTADKANEMVSRYFTKDKIDPFYNLFSKTLLAELSPMHVVMLILSWEKFLSSPRAESIPERDSVLPQFNVVYESVKLLFKRYFFKLRAHEVEKILDRLGLLLFLKKRKMISRSTLDAFLKKEALYVLKAGILSPSKKALESYEPVHQMYFKSIAEKFRQCAQDKLNSSTTPDKNTFFKNILRVSEIVSTIMNVDYGTNKVLHLMLAVRIQDYRKTRKISFRTNSESLEIVRSQHSCSEVTCHIQLTNFRMQRAFNWTVLMDGVWNGNPCKGLHTCTEVLETAHVMCSDLSTTIKMNFESTPTSDVCWGVMNGIGNVINRDLSLAERKGIIVLFRLTSEITTAFSRFMIKIGGLNVSDDGIEVDPEANAKCFFDNVCYRLATRQMLLEKFEAMIKGRVVDLCCTATRSHFWREIEHISIQWKYM